MRAAVISELGGTPQAAERPAPSHDGDVVVSMLAAALNPADLAIASGGFYAGHPPLPYIPGLEAVGRVTHGSDAGKLVYVQGGGLGVSRDGTAAEFFAAPPEALVSLPEEADPAVAAALGTAGLAGWLSLSWRVRLKAGETVLVLGATGTVGSVAVQCAKALGAARVVAAGRDPGRLAKLAATADATVSLAGDNAAAELAAACGDGADVIVDTLWGAPLVAALSAARPGARVAHVGASAGPLAEMPSALVRGRQVEVLGYSNFAVPRDIIMATYRELISRAIAGQLAIDVTAVPIGDVASAWTGLQAGGRKFVLVPTEPAV
jgi:NADPH:quinone reductase